MKTIMLVAALSFIAQAQAGCIGEAQLFPTKVVAIKKTYTECRVFVENAHIEYNPFCPLNDGRLASQGIEVGIVDGHDCALNVGDTISGVLVDNGYNITMAH